MVSLKIVSGNIEHRFSLLYPRASWTVDNSSEPISFHHVCTHNTHKYTHKHLDVDLTFSLINIFLIEI